MFIDSKMKMPKKAQAEAWLNKWGQRLHCGEIRIVKNKYVAKQVQERKEKPYLTPLTSQSIGIHYFSKQAYNESSWILGQNDNFDIDTFYNNLTAIEFLIDSLRKYRDNPSKITRDDISIIRKAFSYFSYQYSALPPNSYARDVLSQAWSEYYEMLHPKNWQHKIFQYKVPELELVPDIEVPAGWIREYIRTTDLIPEDETMEGIQEMVAALGRSIKLNITSLFVADNGEINITLSQHHTNDARTPMQIKALISALCYALETFALTGIEYTNGNGTVNFTLDVEPNQLLDFDLLKASNIAQKIMAKKIEPANIEIIEKEIIIIQQTNAQKVINAAFIGVGLSSPENIFIDHDQKCIIIKTGEPSYNARAMSDEQECQKIDNAIAALSACAELVIDLDDSLNFSPIIKMHVHGYGNLHELDIVKPSDVLHKAMQLEYKLGKRKGPDRRSQDSDGWGMGGIS